MSEKTEKFLRLVEVQSRVPYSRSTIYNLMSQGKFPKAFNLGARAVAWLEWDIDEWIYSSNWQKPGGGDKVNSPFLVINEIRKCESEIWHALAGIVRMATTQWKGSEVARKALERVSCVMDEQARRACAEKDGRA